MSQPDLLSCPGCVGLSIGMFVHDCVYVWVCPSVFVYKYDDAYLYVFEYVT